MSLSCGHECNEMTISLSLISRHFLVLFFATLEKGFLNVSRAWQVNYNL